MHSMLQSPQPISNGLKISECRLTSPFLKINDDDYSNHFYRLQFYLLILTVQRLAILSSKLETAAFFFLQTKKAEAQAQVDLNWTIHVSLAPRVQDFFKQRFFSSNQCAEMPPIRTRGATFI